MVPTGRFEQVPPLPGRLQASQGSEQAVSQHTPSTHLLDLQPTLTVQRSPLFRLSMHLPFSQKLKSQQSSLTEQDWGHKGDAVEHM
jgi:hypothetical protein